MQFGFAGHAARYPKRGLEESVRDRSGAADFASQLVGLLHLGKDLGFAEHHAVEAGGHAEQMADRVVGFERYELTANVVKRHVMKAGQMASQYGRVERHVKVLRGRIQLDAMTG